MSITDKKGINVTSGFKLVSGQPLDARTVVDDSDGLQDLIDNGAVYEGIVVYVKSEQQLKQYNGSEWSNVSSGGSSSGSSDFIDVEELPITKVGTSVPSSGTIEKVYINTSLSNDEIIDIMSSVDLVQVPGFSGNLYAVITTADFSNALSITKDTDDEDRYIVQVVNGEQKLLWSSRNGWVVNDWEINYGYNNMLSVVAPQLGGTVQNDKLKNLISITPFELNSEIDLSKIYRVPEYDWVGTSVPSSGTIEKVYINTQLSNEEIISICESLNMVDIQGLPQCPILTNAYMSAYLTLLYNSNTNYGFVLNGNIGGTSVDYWYSTQGWVNQQSEIAVGFETYLGALAPQVGVTVQNDKITKFISSTPFTRTGALLGYKYYRVIDSIWVEVMGGGINEEEVNTIIAKYMTANYGDGDSEEF